VRMCLIAGGRTLGIFRRRADVCRSTTVQAALLGAITPLVGELGLAL
jgi:hypothetical protein